MSESWQPVPRKPPYCCHATSQDGEKAGPFFEESFTYCPEPGDDREMTLYHSRSWVENMLKAPGSPFACITTDELEQVLARREFLNDRVADLEEEISALQIELEEARAAGSPASAEDVAMAVAEHLEGLMLVPSPKAAA